MNWENVIPPLLAHFIIGIPLGVLIAVDPCKPRSIKSIPDGIGYATAIALFWEVYLLMLAAKWSVLVARDIMEGGSR